MEGEGEGWLRKKRTNESDETLKSKRTFKRLEKVKRSPLKRDRKSKEMIWTYMEEYANH